MGWAWGAGATGIRVGVDGGELSLSIPPALAALGGDAVDGALREVRLPALSWLRGRCDALARGDDGGMSIGIRLESLPVATVEALASLGCGEAQAIVDGLLGDEPAGLDAQAPSPGAAPADPREDLGWDGPRPGYAVSASLAPGTTKDDLVRYLSHSLAQVIDAAVQLGGDAGDWLAFPAGSEWDCDWVAISSLGLTEEEVSFVLSDVGGTDLSNAMTVALGLAADAVLSEHAPEFFALVPRLAAGVLAKASRGAGGPR